MTRIASLLPSATEIVAALGFADALVARSHECDHPDGVAKLPPCTAPKAPLGDTSAEIDRRVREIVREGLSVYRVDDRRLKALDPQVIVTQSQCEVCAVSETELLSAVGDWLSDAVQVVTLKPERLDDIWDDIRRVADALGVTERGPEVVDALVARMAAIAAQARTRPEKPTVGTVEWIDPLMAGGNWMPELVDMAGGRNLFGEAGAHSPWITFADFAAADPDVIVVLPCGFSIAEARRDMPALTGRREWAGLKAVRNGRVHITDGHHFFNRPGPRIVESLEILAEMLHPDEFDFGHKERNWEPL
jgi:iron complex transport system substrate-binding protein